jgi:hypothetical protein
VVLTPANIAEIAMMAVVMNLFIDVVSFVLFNEWYQPIRKPWLFQAYTFPSDFNP